MNSLQDLQAEVGGRPVANDDFLVLQDRDAVLGLPALLYGLVPCVVSGCRVSMTGSQYNVGAGMVWDGIQLLPFSGRSNVVLPAMFAPGAVVVVDERAYQTGGTKTTIKEQSMDLVPVVAGAGNLVMDTWGCLRWNDVVRASVRNLNEVQSVASITVADYDATGLGKPGTEAWGWGLCNGQGNRADLRGQFVAGLDPTRADYDTVGKQGGEERHTLTVAEMPAHRHGYSDRYTVEENTVDAGSNRRRNQDRTENKQTDSTGGDQGHENRPPFYVLTMRQWVGYAI